MRAYRPRLSTLQLVSDILALPGVDGVRVIAPTRGATRRPAGLRVYSGVDGWGKSIYTDFTLPQAREWLEREKEAARG